MKSFEYKPNKSYSAYITTMGFFAGFLFIFNFINFRQNTLLLTLVVFVSVLGWIIYNSFFYKKITYHLVFGEETLELPSKVTESGKKESIMYRDIKSGTLYEGDIQNPKRPGYKGLEIIFERVENLEETIFLQKSHFELNEYNQIIDLINLKLNEAKNRLEE